MSSCNYICLVLTNIINYVCMYKRFCVELHLGWSTFISLPLMHIPIYGAFTSKMKSRQVYYFIPSLFVNGRKYTIVICQKHGKWGTCYKYTSAHVFLWKLMWVWKERTKTNYCTWLTGTQLVGISPPALLVKRYHPNWRFMSHNGISVDCTLYEILRRVSLISL